MGWNRPIPVRFREHKKNGSGECTLYVDQSIIPGHAKPRGVKLVTLSPDEDFGACYVMEPLSVKGVVGRLTLIDRATVNTCKPVIIGFLLFNLFAGTIIGRLNVDPDDRFSLKDLEVTEQRGRTPRLAKKPVKISKTHKAKLPVRKTKIKKLVKV